METTVIGTAVAFVPTLSFVFAALAHPIKGRR